MEENHIYFDVLYKYVDVDFIHLFFWFCFLLFFFFFWLNLLKDTQFSTLRTESCILKYFNLDWDRDGGLVP